MNELVKYKLRFNRNNRKLKKGETARVSIEVYFNRDSRKYVPTDVTITKDQWNEKEKIVNDKNERHVFLNDHLAKKIKGLKTFELELNVKGRSFTPELLERYLQGAGEKGDFNFNKFLWERINKEKGISLGTFKQYKRAYNSLNKYNSNLRFSEVNFSFIKDFDNHLIENELEPNSRAGIHNVLKKFLLLAVSYDLITIKNMPYNTRAGGGVGKFTIPRGISVRTPLNFEERERIEQLKYPDSKKMEYYRDMFLFACFTGLRNCDHKAFNFSHLVYSKKGYSIDLHRMIKTKRPVYLELFTLFDGKPEKILRKYLIKKYGTDDYEKILQTGDTSPIFKGVAGNIFNPKLKQIIKDAQIQKYITHHCGRHTFGTQMAILTGGNQYLVMDLMGHGNPQTTQIYVKLGERMVNRQLRNVDWSAFDSKSTQAEENEETKEIPQETEPTDYTTSNLNDNTNIINDAIQQMVEYIHSDVISQIGFKAKEKIPFAINTESLQNYIEQLPFSTADLEKYQKQPFEVDAYFVGMKHSKHIAKFEKSINNNEWVKESCINFKMKLIPIAMKGLKVIDI